MADDEGSSATSLTLISPFMVVPALLIVGLSVFYIYQMRSAEERALAAEQKAIAAQQMALMEREKGRAIALAASQEFARQAVRAAQEGRFKEAERRIEAAVSIAPDSPWAPYAKGAIARTRGDLPAAREHFKRALKLDPSHTFSKAALSELAE